MTIINQVFRSLSRTKKVEFISQNIEYANAGAIAGYAQSYILDILDNLEPQVLKLIACYISQKGLTEKKGE